MAAKRLTKVTIDWAELAKRVPTHQKSNLLAFKSKSDSFLRKVSVHPEEPPKIDWAFYKTNAANKAVVEQLEKQYNSLKIPYPSDGGAVSKIEQEEKLFNEQLRAFVAASNERIQKYEKELEVIRKTTPYDEMTEEEFAYAHPELTIEPLTNPTFYPHTAEAQLDEEDLEFYRKCGFIVYPGPDTFLEKHRKKFRL